MTLHQKALLNAPLFLQTLLLQLYPDFRFFKKILFSENRGAYYTLAWGMLFFRPGSALSRTTLAAWFCERAQKLVEEGESHSHLEKQETHTRCHPSRG